MFLISDSTNLSAHVELKLIFTNLNYIFLFILVDVHNYDDFDGYDGLSDSSSDYSESSESSDGEWNTE